MTDAVLPDDFPRATAQPQTGQGPRAMSIQTQGEILINAVDSEDSWGAHQRIGKAIFIAQGQTYTNQ